MVVSRLAKTINESPTLRLSEQARILRARGEPVIHLGIGEPKNKTPMSALLSAAARLNAGDIKYTPTDGMPSLKKAIIRYTENNYSRLVAPENIIVSTGAKQSIYNILFTIVNPQEEVILLAPYWVSYPEMVKMVSGVPVVVAPEDGTFHPSVRDIEQAVSSKTRAIILNSPNNPSGVLYSEDFIAEIVAYCEKKGIYLICDDIYQKLIFDDKIAVPAYNYTKEDIESSHLIVVNGVSKMYGMTGFRIGWVVGPRKLVKVMTNIQAQMTSNPAVISQAAAEGALLGDQSVVESLRLTIQNNRDVMLNELLGLNGVQVTKPDGTFYCLPDFRSFGMASTELANFVLEKALVVTVPGSEFGMEGYLRLSYAGSVKDIKDGIERLKWALDPESSADIYIGTRRLTRDWL
ncbi:MAG: pyridoxal phosphate-dependent aminotransferase [Anaerolineales bacterium]|jgi:aspartate aminotransferase|nr:pyridoxal phosphate-dependent aminotransferase [Anaerolineales bacterium]